MTEPDRELECSEVEDEGEGEAGPEVWRDQSSHEGWSATGEGSPPHGGCEASKSRSLWWLTQSDTQSACERGVGRRSVYTQTSSTRGGGRHAVARGRQGSRWR